MKFHHPTANIFVPDGLPVSEAMARVTHLGIGAHHDDLEFMALHGILACYDMPSRWFGGVTCTDGAGSVRAGAFANLTDEQLKAVRRREQNEAATIGRYGMMCQLDHTSQAIKNAHDGRLKKDLQTVLTATRPEIVYTHNLADKHGTHIGVVVAAMQAIREMPPQERPAQVWGCEVWRGLDWMLDSDKVVMDVSGHDDLAAALSRVFASQIASGKRYDLATFGRRTANATFFDPHATDKTDQVIFGMDLTPLIRDESLDMIVFVDGFIERFHADVTFQLGKQLGRSE